MATTHRGKNYGEKVVVAAHENRCNHQSLYQSLDESRQFNENHQTLEENHQLKDINVPHGKSKNWPLKSTDDPENRCSHCRDTTQPFRNCSHISQVNGRSPHKNINKLPKTLFHQALNKCFASKQKKCQHKNKCHQPPRLTQSTRHSCKPIVRDHESQRKDSQHEILCHSSGDKCQVTCSSQKHQPVLPPIDKPGYKSNKSLNQSHQPSGNHQPTKRLSPRMCSTPKKQKYSSSFLHVVKVHSGTNEQFLKIIRNSENASSIVRRKFKRRFAFHRFVPELKPIEEHEEKESTTEVEEDVNTEDLNAEDVYTEETGTELGSEDVNNDIVNCQAINTEDENTEDINTENVYTQGVNTEDINTENVSTGIKNGRGSHKFGIKCFFRTLVVWCARLFTCFLPQTKTEKKTN